MADPDSKEFDVVVLGDANPDLILSGGDVVPRFGQAETLVDSGALTLGGSGAITASGLARLGLRTAMVAVVGDDPLGKLTIDNLVDAGVDISGVTVRSEVPTGISVHLVDGDDRAIITHVGSIDSLQASDVPTGLLENTRHVHASSVFLLERLRSDLESLLAHAKRHGASTSVDTNWDPSERWDIDGLLDHCDLLLPNAQEVGPLSGQIPPTPSAIGEASLALLKKVGMVAVKEGPDGGRVVYAVEGGLPESAIVSQAPTMDVVDAIGAGDSFNAGFLFGLLRAEPPMKALQLGVACGSLSVRAAGGTGSQATSGEANRLARSLT